MSATFMQDPNYVEVCGKRTILELATSIISIFDKHDNKFPASALEAKTFGRVVDLTALRDEMSCIQSFLEEFEEPLGFLCQTVLLLRERLSAHKERLESLKKQTKEQEELRAKFEVAARLPTLPREITDNVLSLIPSSNKLIWQGDKYVYVDGLIPLAVYNPSLLLPYYEGGFNDKWTLGAIAKQELRRSILDDASLADHIKLRAEHRDNRTSHYVSDLRPLMNYPHLWKKLGIYPFGLVMDDFINWYKPCFPFLEELDIGANYVTSSTVVAPLDRSRLKTARLRLRTFSDFFNTGCLRSITSLTLYCFDPCYFGDNDAFKEALHIFPHIIGQLPSLYELALDNIWCNLDYLEGLSRIKSTLRILDVNFYDNDSVLAPAFLSLFADCHIDSIGINASLLREAEVLFGGVLRVCVEGYDLAILSERNADGNLPFRRMELLELTFDDYTRKSTIDIPQLQNQLLQAVRVRSGDPTVCKIARLRMPRVIVPNAEYEEEIERYVHSLVLTNWGFIYQ